MKACLAFWKNKLSICAFTADGERLLGKKDGNAGGREMDAAKPARGGLEKMRQGIAAKYHSG